MGGDQFEEMVSKKSQDFFAIKVVKNLRFGGVTNPVQPDSRLNC